MPKIVKVKDFNFKKLKVDFERFKIEIPILAGNLAKNHFLQGFKKGGGQTERSKGGWRGRKPLRGRAGSRSQGRALLVDSGDLRADIRVRGATFRKTVINTKRINYASFHNEGLGKLPRREFVGVSRSLEKKTLNLINKKLKKITRNASR